MIRIISIGNVKVWLFIEHLRAYTDDRNDIIELNEFICYFKFSEPNLVTLGELVRAEDGTSYKSFGSAEEAEQYTTEYIRKKYHLK